MEKKYEDLPSIHLCMWSFSFYEKRALGGKRNAANSRK
jgi:hypothetical protein